ncbi:protein NODULATION SIGNALING PATHWAY 1 [Euphorbia lathyris]|uniref:protein NODULATION SIGNALING PATHWAY 1 n=1 Tax=Euphorbia lathyris TaxID=212925 RepID=UPI0033143B85
MTIEEPEPNRISDHILDWLEDSVSFLPSILLDDPYNPYDINNYEWWNPNEEDQFNQFPINTTSFTTTTTTTTTSSLLAPTPYDDQPVLDHPPPSRKREAVDDPVPETSQKKKQNTKEQGVEVVAAKRSNGNKKNNTKNTANNGNKKEGRWAEHLLNPCASAITSGNLSRVQHLIYVLHELASSTGDANHRLAFYGLRALTHHLSSSPNLPSIGPLCFASTEPKFFQRSLIKFYEVSPWFAFPNNIANSSILQILGQEVVQKRSLHILDIGVSHGVQWPTLLEALTRRSGGPPSLVRITVVTATGENDPNAETPFSVGPPEDNFSSRLLGFAKSMNINLQINRLENHSLQSLNAQAINTNPEETLIVCAQFRLHHLNHNPPDERTEFLKVLRGLDPSGVILSENNTDCSCNSCGDFATAFSRRVDNLWKFLDSTSSAFKGRECEERRVMEGEAARALTNQKEMNEGKEKWCARMKSVGFVGEVFGEDAIDGAKALLRKYDSNWEMRMEEKDKCIGLWWKGQPVSFCSLWKSSDTKENDS